LERKSRLDFSQPGFLKTQPGFFPVDFFPPPQELEDKSSGFSLDFSGKKVLRTPPLGEIQWNEKSTGISPKSSGFPVTEQALRKMNFK
jgi:hypothetical protein